MMVVTPLGHCWRAEQRHRLLADPLGVARQVHGQDQLPALGPLVAPERVGIGALLHLALRGSTASASMPPPGLDDLLLDKGAFGVGKGLVLCHRPNDDSATITPGVARSPWSALSSRSIFCSSGTCHGSILTGVR